MINQYLITLYVYIRIYDTWFTQKYTTLRFVEYKNHIKNN